MTVPFVHPDLKGTVPRDFRLQVSYMDQFPQAPAYTIRAVWVFLKICGDIRSSRRTTGVIDTGGKWKNLKSENFSLFLLDTFGY